MMLWRLASLLIHIYAVILYTKKTTIKYIIHISKTNKIVLDILTIKQCGNYGIMLCCSKLRGRLFYTDTKNTIRR